MPRSSFCSTVGIPYAIVAFVVDVDSDANHEGQTLAVMHRLSAPDKVPAYMLRVVKAVQEFTDTFDGIDARLNGNIIPGNPRMINNSYLRGIAEDMIKLYCK